MNNFAVRMVTILIGSTIGISSVLYNQYTMIGFFTIITLGCFIEFSNLTFSDDRKSFGKKLSYFSSYIFIYLIYLYFITTENSHHKKYNIAAFILTLMTMTGGDILLCLAFSIWILPSMIICTLYAKTNPYLLIMMMTIIWLTDGGAYITGKLIGKRKIFGSISPNKTLEGTICGILFSMFTSHFIFIHIRLFSLDYINVVILAFITGVVGQIGDLIESLFKRKMKTKDTGFLIVGHGGFMDRFDSIFTAIPISYLYFHLMVPQMI